MSLSAAGASDSTSGRVEIGSVDLRFLNAYSLDFRKDLRLVLSDYDTKVYLNSRAGGASAEAVRGALRLASAAHRHAYELSIRIGMQSTPVGLHQADESTWLCRECGDLWPCEMARRELSREYLGSPLALYLIMLNAYVLASIALKGEELHQVADRLLGWFDPPYPV